jgi:hypothetical protein
MSGATKKIEEASKALEAGLIKKAVLLTDSVKTEKQHKLVVDIAKKCIADKENCKDFCKEGAVMLKDSITPTTDTNDDLEEVLAAEAERGQESPSSPTAQESPSSLVEDKPEMTAEEAYNSCEECNIAAAAVEFVKIAEKDECDGTKVTEKLQPLLDDKLTPPEKWLKTMAEITEEATCDKLKYGEVLGGLTDYLEKKDSQILKNIDKGTDSLSTTH